MTGSKQISRQSMLYWLAAGLILMGAGVLLLHITSNGRAAAKDNSTKQAAETIQSDVRHTSMNWPIFRNDPQLRASIETNLQVPYELAWRFETEDTVRSSPVVKQGVVYIGSNDKNIYAIDRKTGRRIWAYETGDMVEAPPLIIDNVLYVGSTDTWFYALDAETGTLIWKTKTGGKIMGSANWFEDPKGNLRILVGSYDTKLYCLDAGDGTIHWTYETGNYVNGSCAVDRGRIVFGGCDGFIHVVDTNGVELQRIDAGTYIAASAALQENLAYIGNYEGRFMSANIETGQMEWTYEPGEDPFFSSPAVNEKYVVIGGRDRRLHILERKTGRVVWTTNVQNDIDSSPVLADGRVLFGSMDGRLRVIDIEKKMEVWSTVLGDAIVSSPAVSGGMIFVGCDDGYLYAFRNSSEKQ